MSPAYAGYDVNIPPPHTPVAHQIYDLHLYILYICAVIFVIVFGAMFYALLHFRKSKGAKADQNFHESTAIEVIWTIIPFLVLIAIAVPATTTVLDMKDTTHADMTIKVTGYQWKWSYEYPQQNILFYSTLRTPWEEIENTKQKNPEYLLEVDNPLVVPVGKKVRVLLTSSDVIHGWYVPQLGINQYGIPGFIKDVWFKAESPGTYKGQCSQICGKLHGYMPITVVAKSPAEFEAWAKEQSAKTPLNAATAAPAQAAPAAAAAPAAVPADSGKTWTLAELKQQGEKVYAANCVACHQANGQGTPPAFPALNKSKIVIGPKADQISLLLKGKPGTAMASFAHLSDSDIAAVITYERNSWDNATGEAIQPGEVSALRGGGAPAVAATPAAAAPSAAAGLPARLYFEIGKANLPADAQSSIQAAVDFLKANASAKVDITGYTDRTGNLDKNLELAKERAKAVREALKSAGVAAERINMKPPAAITGSGSDKEARRVEINAGS